MDDQQIVDLYWVRTENAISETAHKYGRYCHYIAYNILHNDEDSEECVNDTYLKAWNIIPPQRPNKLSTFLGKITRNLALDRYKYNSRQSISWYSCWRIEDKGTYASKENPASEEDVRDFRFDCS